jgi:hypothetical protein
MQVFVDDGTPYERAGAFVQGSPSQDAMVVVRANPESAGSRHCHEVI